MKKLLAAIITLAITISCLSVVCFAQAAPVDNSTATETKTVESLVGAYYMQGECGTGDIPGGAKYTTDYDYTIADQLANVLNGTERVPFYGYTRNNALHFDRFSKTVLINEMDLAAAAGIDFIAYKYYAGVGKNGTIRSALSLMNAQFKQHVSAYTQAVGFAKPVMFCGVVDGDFDANRDATYFLNDYMLQKGYLTSEDGRPVVFILWSDAATVKDQVDVINRKFGNAVKNGYDESKKNSAETIFPIEIQTAYFIALNAPSYAEATAAGCEAISWYAGSGSNGEAYSAMVERVEANWTSNAENVIPNVVTGFDKSVLAGKTIKVDGMLKYYDDEATSVRYQLSGKETDKVAKATTEELVAHVKKAVETTNKPANLKATMIYAWDDFAGGAYLCPTKTATEYQYEYSYLKALRQYFYGNENLPVVKFMTDGDADYKFICTDVNGIVMKYDYDEKLVAKLDAQGNPVVDATPTSIVEENNDEGGINVLYIAIAAGAVVVIAVVVIIIVAASKKKKAAGKAE